MYVIDEQALPGKVGGRFTHINVDIARDRQRCLGG